MIFLKTGTYMDLLAKAARAEVAEAQTERLLTLNERLLDTILAMKVGGADLPPGYGEEGFGVYSFDEVEEEVTEGQAVQPGPMFPDEVDQEDLLDIARALKL